MTLGQAISKRRREMGLSGNALAKKAGVNHSLVYAIEAGTKTPRWDSICRIATALEMDLNELPKPKARKAKRT